MRWILAMAMAVAFACGGAGVAQAAAVKVAPEKMRLNDTGTWERVCKVHYLDGSWDWGFIRWTGVQSQIDWGTAVVFCLQGNGGGFQPEPQINMIGAWLEIVGDTTQSPR